MSDEVASLKAELERVKTELARYRRLFLCNRCGQVGHEVEECIEKCGGVDDVFMRSRIDPRFNTSLPLEMWTEALRRMHIVDVVKLPCVSRALSEVVWGRTAGALLWRELPKDMINTEYRYETILWHACRYGAGVETVKTLLVGGAKVTYRVVGVAVTYKCGEGVLKALVSAGGAGKLGGQIWSGMSQYDLKRLISVGADVNYVNHEGFTPLMRAAKHKAIGNIRILVAAGAHTDIRSSAAGYDGMTASEIAAATFPPDVCARIQRAINGPVRKKRVVK